MCPDRKPCLDYLIDPSYQVVNRIFVLSFENDADIKVHTGYSLPKVDIKDLNFRTDAKNLFDQSKKEDIITHENIRKNATGQGDNYSTGCSLDYPYFKENYYKLISIDLSKQQALDADPRKIQQINFTDNLDVAAVGHDLCMHLCILFLKKQKKLFSIFHK